MRISDWSSDVCSSDLLVRYRGMDYTTTVAAGLLILFGVLFALWLVWKLVTLPFRPWRGHRDKQSRARLGGGLEALHHGPYARAQKLLQQAAAQDRKRRAEGKMVIGGIDRGGHQK